jgi:PAS domain S-box-containing protein
MRLRRYAIVPVVLAAALLVRWLILGGEMPFLLAWPVVVLCAWYGGFGAGLLATLLAVVVTTCLHYQPPHWFALAQPEDWAGVALFLLLGTAISLLCELLQRARRQVEGQAHDLYQQREWFRVTLASIGDGLIATDEHGRVTFLNAVAQALTGWKESDAQGRPIEEVFQIVHAQTRKPIVNPVHQALERHTRVGQADQAVLLSRAGIETPVDDSAAPIRREDGSIQGVVLVFRDITERQALERGLRERARELAEADRRKDEFLAILAHELRNPLAPIRTACEILRHEDAAPEDQARAREVIDRQAGQALRLVEDLLDHARIRQGKVRLERRPVELAGVIAQAVEASRPLIDARRHELMVRLPDQAIWLDADPARLVQVVSNLLNNAAKYTEEGGHIWLSARRHDDNVVLRVRDDGIGIPPDMLPRVFELFAQAEQALGKSQGGLGIGLRLVRTLVEAHGGSVEVQSAGPGKGSQFIVRLPFRPEGPGPAKTNGAPSADRARRVLIVDDNRDAADTLAHVMSGLGHEVRIAYDGGPALQLAQEFRPDVVLLDLGMPTMDGHEVARRLRQLPALAGTRLIALTGSADEGRLREEGFDAVLVKPVETSAVQDALRDRAPERDAEFAVFRAHWDELPEPASHSDSADSQRSSTAPR